MFELQVQVQVVRDWDATGMACLACLARQDPRAHTDTVTVTGSTSKVSGSEWHPALNLTHAFRA